MKIRGGRDRRSSGVRRTTLPLLLCYVATGLAGQGPDDRWHLGAQGSLTATRADPVPGRGSLTEARLEQPMLSLGGSLLRGHLQFSSAISLDRLTTPDGVLTLGGWGGGYYDRQHPHDYLHEAVVSLVGDIRSTRRQGRISLSGGKGVVPFGSDPPMARPPLRSPVNHHWSQVLERWLVVLGLRTGAVGFELALFDGRDGTESDVDSDSTHAAHCAPGEDCPTVRFGDSRSARLTLRPAGGLEVRGSLGTIKAPGHHPGAGFSLHRMWHLAARLDRPVGGGRADLRLELGRSRIERTYWTALAEAEWARGDHRFYLRVERTDRPEGPRGTDLFRSAPDTLDAALVGVTRWTVQTLGYGYSLWHRTIRLEPMVEFSLGRVASVGTPRVDLEALYGRRSLWSGVVGLRLSLGAPHTMGRYGALADADSVARQHQH